MMRIDQYQFGAFCLRLPDGFGCLDAVLFGRFILSQDNAVPD